MDIRMIKNTLENVVVVLNVGGVVDTNFYNGLGNYDADDEHCRGKIEGLDSLLLMSQAGQNGGAALVKILNGTANPSGKLTDTWAINLEDYPSTKGFSYLDGNEAEEFYTDDIYVGYRYFDTFGKDVAYPFGFGESYTDFEITVDSVSADEENITVEATVKNTGSADGKEVVQVYFSAPGEDKPFQELAAFRKVGVEAGKEEKVSISFPITEMSSYNEEQEAYILDKGSYTIRAGNSSRNTVEAADITLDADVVTEYAANQLGLTKKEMKEGTYSKDAGFVLNYEKVKAANDEGPEEEVGSPAYEPIALDMLDASSEGYGTGIEPTANRLSAEAEELEISSAVFGDPEAPAYSEGFITTYVSSDEEKDSAVYRASHESNPCRAESRTADAAGSAGSGGAVNGNKRPVN